MDSKCSSSVSSSSEDLMSELGSDLEDGSVTDLEDILKAKLKLKRLLFKMDKNYFINKFREEQVEAEKDQLKFFEKLLENVKSITKSV